MQEKTSRFRYYAGTADWSEDQLEEDWVDDFKHHKSFINPSEQRRSPTNRGVYIPANEIMQECIQNAQKYMKIWTVQHQDQTKVVPELCHLHPSVRLRVLENDSKQPHQTISLPQKKTWEELKEFSGI